MDRLEQLGTSLSEITAYDIKSYWAAAKAAVMNYSEMETKVRCSDLEPRGTRMLMLGCGQVREATNDDPWSVAKGEV